MVREHGEGTISLLAGTVHVLDEVAPEVPVLKPDRVIGFLQHPSNPGRPNPISLVEADEEVTLGIYEAHWQISLLKRALVGDLSALCATNLIGLTRTAPALRQPFSIYSGRLRV